MKTACNIGTCHRCDISIRRKNIVLGQGSTSANLMIIGEAPGAKEDTQGIPFVGAAGNLLQYYLDLYGIDREHIYLTNIIKCKTKANSKPNKIEISNCREYLLEELAIVQPTLIVLLGNTAIKEILHKDHMVRKLAGIPIELNNTWFMPMYHPSHILHNTDLIFEYNKHWEIVYELFKWLNPMYNFKPKFLI